MQALGVLLLLAVPSLAQAAPEVSLVIENPKGPVLPGQTVLYHLRVANRSAAAATGALVLEASIPQHMSVQRETWGRCLPSQCANSGYVARYGNVVSWSLPSLEPGASVQHIFTATIDNSAENPAPSAGTEILLEALVKAGATKAASASSTVTVQAVPAAFDLSVSGTTRAPAGSEVEYELRYGNTSSAAASGVLRVAVPKGARVLLASQGAVQKGSSIEWPIASLPAGHSDFRALRLKLDAGLGAGTYLKLEPELQSSGSKAIARASTSTLVGAKPQLSFTFGAKPDPAVPGATIVYKLEVTNDSPNVPSGDFTVFATIPEHVGVSRQQGSRCLPHQCANSGYEARHGDLVQWTVKSLAPGATAPLQFTAIVDKPAAAAPPPNGSILSTRVRTAPHDVVQDLALALGSSSSIGKGTPLVPLGSAPVASAPAPAAPAAAPAPTPSEPEPVLVATAPEPTIEEIPDSEIEAQLPPAEETVTPAEEKQRRKWKHGDWDKYCAARWQSRRWDRACAKHWWKRADWNKYCKAEGRKHDGWGKFCRRDFKAWHFARHGHGGANASVQHGKASKAGKKDHAAKK